MIKRLKSGQGFPRNNAISGRYHGGFHAPERILMKYANVAAFRKVGVGALCSLLVLAGGTRCAAHQQPVHMQISQSAAQSSYGLTNFLADCLGVKYRDDMKAPELSLRGVTGMDDGSLSPLDWIRNGSKKEDDGARSNDHFYTVTTDRTAGEAPPLSDGSETLGILAGGMANSYAWATDPNTLSPWFLCPSGEHNIYRWDRAREYQLLALVSPSKTDRESYLAAMLSALGHELHLNQDLSEPEHVRNDAHVWNRAIEGYGEKVYLANALANHEQNMQQYFPRISPRDWTYWRDQGFTKLLAFWDRGLYVNGNSRPLDEDAGGLSGAKLGLAEFSNGNFLGQNAIYSNFFRAGESQCFPHPALADTSQPHLKGPIWNIGGVELPNGKQGDRVYVKKLRAGVQVAHHSVVNYLPLKHPGKLDPPPKVASLTIDDPNVLLDYHTNLIPKAIEYSAGILDYFFRGRLEVLATLGAGQYQLHIINRSGQALRGGTFTLYQDDSSGNRTPVPLTLSWTAQGASASTLADGAALDGTFAGTFTTDTKFTLVYQGTIGIGPGSPPPVLDTIDAWVAIAVKTFVPGTRVRQFLLEFNTTSDNSAAVFPSPQLGGDVKEFYSVDVTASPPVVNFDGAIGCSSGSQPDPTGQFSMIGGQNPWAYAVPATQMAWGYGNLAYYNKVKLFGPCSGTVLQYGPITYSWTDIFYGSLTLPDVDSTRIITVDGVNYAPVSTTRIVFGQWETATLEATQPVTGGGDWSDPGQWYYAWLGISQACFCPDE